MNHSQNEIEIGVSYRINLSSQENEDLMEFFKETKIELNPKNLSMYLMSTIYEVDSVPEKEENAFSEFVREHGGIITQAGSAIISNIIKKRQSS